LKKGEDRLLSIQMLGLRRQTLLADDRRKKKKKGGGGSPRTCSPLSSGKEGEGEKERSFWPVRLRRREPASIGFVERGKRRERQAGGTARPYCHYPLSVITPTRARPA